MGTTDYDVGTGIVELSGNLPKDDLLVGPDILPVPKEKRTWGYLAYIGNWSTVIDAAPFAVGGAAVALGVPVIEAIVASLISIVFLYFLIIIQSHAASRYGLAEPQLERVRFGIYGQYIASLTRGIIALGWFGIQTYVFTEVVDGLYYVLSGKTAVLLKIVSAGPLAELHANPALFIGTFIAVYILESFLMYLSKVSKSQKAIRHILLANIPIAILAFTGVFVVVMSQIHWNFGIAISAVSAIHSNIPVFLIIFILLNAVLADVITISMSMPDLVRFAKSQKVQIYSQLFVIPFYFAATAFGILASAASLHIYGTVIYDPVLLTTLSSIPLSIKILLLVGIAYATYAVNVQANLLAPSYDMSNLYPGKFNFWRGSLIAIVISLALQGWALYYNAVSFLEGWLGLYGTFLGPIVGVIIADYFVIRRFKFDPNELYNRKGQYRYLKGFNPAAIIAVAVPVALLLLPIPGHATMSDLSTYIGFAIAFVISLFF